MYNCWQIGAENWGQGNWLRTRWSGVRVSPGAPYFQRLMTLLKIKCFYETQKFLENSDFQGGKRWLANCRRERVHLRSVCL